MDIYTKFSESVAFRMRMDKPAEIMNLTWALGLVGETGEVVDLIKKHIGHSHPLDRAKLVKELGDVEWYMEAIRKSFSVARQTNLWDCSLKANTEVAACRQILYLADEVADVAELIADIDFNSTQDLEEYMGSVDSRLQSVYERYGITREEALEANIAKLKERYPNGFSTEASINRKDVKNELVRDSSPS